MRNWLMNGSMSIVFIVQFLWVTTVYFLCYCTNHSRKSLNWTIFTLSWDRLLWGMEHKNDYKLNTVSAKIRHEQLLVWMCEEQFDYIPPSRRAFAMCCWSQSSNALMKALNAVSGLRSKHSTNRSTCFFQWPFSVRIRSASVWVIASVLMSACNNSPSTMTFWSKVPRQRLRTIWWNSVIRFSSEADS